MEGALAGGFGDARALTCFWRNRFRLLPNQILSVFNSIGQPPAKLDREITVEARQEFERQE